MNFPPISSNVFQHQAVSGLLGAIGVACGAFGAHGLKNHTSDPALLESWKTAASYQMLHVTLQKPRWDWGGVGGLPICCK